MIHWVGVEAWYGHTGSHPPYTPQDSNLDSTTLKAGALPIKLGVFVPPISLSSDVDGHRFTLQCRNAVGPSRGINFSTGSHHPGEHDGERKGGDREERKGGPRSTR